MLFALARHSFFQLMPCIKFGTWLLGEKMRKGPIAEIEAVVYETITDITLPFVSTLDQIQFLA